MTRATGGTAQIFIVDVKAITQKSQLDLDMDVKDGDQVFVKETFFQPANMDSINPTAPGSHSLGQLGIKLYRFRGLLKRQWWILALTIGFGLAWQGWGLANKPQAVRVDQSDYHP